MQSSEIRQRFLDFFAKRGHAVIPSSSLVPENDPSVLFNTAGMQPLVPYLLGQTHPAGKRLVDVQKCVRTQDIEEVGDNTHDTFFEMLGNWSLGDYFKEDAIKWSYELLTNKEEGFGLDPARIYVTCFEGDENAARDEESFAVWRSLGVPENKIYFLPARSNWWSPGPNGPCGPDTEMFYDLRPEQGEIKNKEDFLGADSEQRVIEVWNDVFMEYEKKDNKVVGKLKNKNVDTGAGLERLTMVLQEKDNIFATDLFAPLMAKISELSNVTDEKARRVVADHIRTAVFMIADGVTPANTDRGYVLRRLLRRAVRYADLLEFPANKLSELAAVVIKKYERVYPEVKLREFLVKKEIEQEEAKFRETLQRGMREFERGEDPFILATSHGFPIELITELAKEKGREIDLKKFEAQMVEHQAKSRAGAEQKFKGGLADHSEQVVRYHTATHLLHQALHEVLGEGVMQKGSNITAERLRFDFAHNAKMTDEEKKRVEEIVNEKISADLPVQNVVLPKAEAEKLGARMFFGDKYGDQVSVYYIGDSLETAYSKEFCGGPHVSRTGELGRFRIAKEEAVAAGVRRIKAVLE